MAPIILPRLVTYPFFNNSRVCLWLKITSPGLVDEVLAAAEKVLGKDAVQPLDGPVMGAEDFSLYIEKLKKGVFFRLGTAEENDSEPVALHNSHFDFNDEAIPYGIATMVQLVLDQHQ